MKKFLLLFLLLPFIGFNINSLNAQCTVPSTPSPSPPNGPVNPCEGSTVTYSVASSTDANSYSWFYPSDWTLVSGETTKTITLKVGTSGNIGVYGVNSCGNKSYNSSQRNIQVIRIPSTPSQPSSYSPTCNGFTAQWATDGTVVDYLVDVSTESDFSSFVSPYHNYNAGNVQFVALTGLVSSTKYYYRIRRSSSCGISPDYSPSNNAVTSVGGAKGAVTGGITKCSGANSGILTLAGHTGTVQKWQSSVSPFTTWSDISNITTTYTSGALFNTTQFRAVIVSSGCTSYSTSTTVTITPEKTVTLTSAVGTNTQSKCNNTAITPITYSTTGATGATFTGLPAGVTGVWASNVVKISGTPTATGSFPYTATLSGGCGIVTATGTITVTAANTITLSSGVGTNNKISCISKALTNITYSTTGTTGATFTGLPAGVTGVWASDVVTISGTPTVSGSFPYSVILTGGCGTVTATGTITVNDLPSAPTIGLITPPTCAVPTGSFTITNYNTSSYSYTFSPSTGISITTAGVVTAAPGTYTITASNGSCSSTLANVVINNPPATKTWNGTSWSPDPLVMPTIENPIIFTGNYNSSSNLDACSCQVTNGAQVVINSAHTLTVTNRVEVVSGSTLTFENNASLVQVNDDAVNTGSITYKRYTQPVKRYDFTYWSTPVEKQTMVALSPNTLYDKYYRYDNGWKIEKNGAFTMIPGEGYIIRAPQNFSITVAQVDMEPMFKGKPNNGKIEKTVTAGLDYLLGNPYPSALYADQFLFDNKDVLDGTLYFWTHNSPPNNAVGGDYKYNYTASDYASYNLTGGVGTGTGTAAETEIDKNNKPTGKIAAAQGFFAKTKAGISAESKVVFNNGMRVSGNNSQFFKLNNTSKTTTTSIEKNRVWLNLTNSEGAFKQTLVGYITGATNDYEGSFDGVTYDGNSFLDFYSVNEGTNLAIQGRALPFVKKDSVVLGYRSTIKGEFQISIDATDGVLTTQNIFVEDQDLKVLHDLKKEPYNFSTEVGTFNNRFVLRYVDKNVVEVIPEPEAPEVLYKDVLVSVQNAQVKINSPVELIDKVILYDAAGRKIYQKNKVEANVLLIDHLISSKQLVLVDILLSNGTKLSRKIVY